MALCIVWLLVVVVIVEVVVLLVYVICVIDFKLAYCVYVVDEILDMVGTIVIKALYDSVVIAMIC